MRAALKSRESPRSLANGSTVLQVRWTSSAVGIATRSGKCTAGLRPHTELSRTRRGSLPSALTMFITCLWQCLAASAWLRRCRPAGPRQERQIFGPPPVTQLMLALRFLPFPYPQLSISLPRPAAQVLDLLGKLARLPVLGSVRDSLLQLPTSCTALSALGMLLCSASCTFASCARLAQYSTR